MNSLKFAAAAAGTLALLSGSAAAQQSVRMATSWPGGIHLEHFATGFAKQADTLSGGKVKFQVFPAGTIGSPLKIAETVQTMTVSRRSSSDLVAESRICSMCSLMLESF